MSIKKNFEYENISFEYSLLKQERKTITATVYPNLELLIKAPKNTTFQEIQFFLQRKLRWILKQKRYFTQFKQEEQKNFVSGETFRYRGRSYKLLLHSNSESARVSLHYGVLNVFMINTKSSDTAKELLKN